MKYFGLVLMLIIMIVPAWSEQENPLSESTPTWLILEYGKKAYRDKDFGKAMWYFREILRRDGPTHPDAHMWIARIYNDADGEPEMAIKHLETALKHRRQLFVPADQYIILYELADIYRFKSNLGKVQEQLELIVAGGEAFEERDPFEGDAVFKAADKDAVRKILYEKGFNEVVRLFRYSSDFSLRAHIELGILFSESGRSIRALDHLVYALLSMMTRSIAEIRTYYTDYAYESLEGFFLVLEEFPRVREYLKASQFFLSLFYLGSTLTDSGYGSEGIYLWSMVERFSTDDTLRMRARKMVSRSSA